MQINNKRILGWIVLAIIAIAILLIGINLYNRWHTASNPILPGEQTTTEIKVNDSIVILKQLLYIAENRKDLTNDTVIKEAIKAGKIKPETVVQWKTIYAGAERNIKLEDSMQLKINELLASYQEAVNSGDEVRASLLLKFEKEKQLLYSTRVPFNEISKYRVLKGDIGFDSNIRITSDSIISEPFVVFGEKPRILGIGRPEYSVVIGDKNPLIKASNAKSITYKPPVKTSFSMGPMIMSNGKEISAGVGVNFKRGILSIGLGYQLVNTK